MQQHFLELNGYLGANTVRFKEPKWHEEKA